MHLENAAKLAVALEAPPGAVVADEGGDADLVLPPPQAARTRANTEHTASSIIDLARRGEAVNTEVFML